MVVLTHPSVPVVTQRSEMPIKKGPAHDDGHVARVVLVILQLVWRPAAPPLAPYFFNSPLATCSKQRISDKVAIRSKTPEKCACLSTL